MRRVAPRLSEFEAGAAGIWHDGPVRALTLSLLFILTACASSKAPGPAVVYPIDRKTADRIAYDALRRELPASRIRRIEHRDPGFRCTFDFDGAPYIIEIYLFPAKGIREDGTVVDGIRFDIDHDGVHPLGDEKAVRVARLIRQEARETAKPLPAAK